jgi:hypothetical protein
MNSGIAAATRNVLSKEMCILRRISLLIESTAIPTAKQIDCQL